MPGAGGPVLPLRLQAAAVRPRLSAGALLPAHPRARPAQLRLRPALHRRGAVPGRAVARLLGPAALRLHALHAGGPLPRRHLRRPRLPPLLRRLLAALGFRAVGAGQAGSCAESGGRGVGGVAGGVHGVLADAVADAAGRGGGAGAACCAPGCVRFPGQRLSPVVVETG